MRRTVNEQLEFRGTGLHGGQAAILQIVPAPAGTGIVFIRSDLPVDEARIPARYDLVNDTRLCTKLTNAHGASVSTIEHLMAALAGTGVHDVVIRVDGPEVPILDGSSLPFVRDILRVGLKDVGIPLDCIRVLKPIEVESNGRVARLVPAKRTEISFTIDFDDPAIGRQSLALALGEDAFVAELAECRTFCLLSEVEALRQAGLARGGGLENAIVVDRGRVLNPEGLRRADEFVRHKILDAVGDLALAGAPIIGRYEGERSGHEMTNLLLRALFAAPDSWEWAEAELEVVPVRQPRPLFAEEKAAALAS
ncbi:MAG: UDP-3-O-acyl-N-acetylglucosamine deacetylase [Pseudomonadota bacterium]